VHPDLKTVIELQQVDLRIAELALQVEGLPAKIQAVEAELDRFIHSYGERKQRLAANQRERRDLEGDIQAIQAKISKHKDQLYEVKSNEHYSAMLKEIAGEEENIRKIEDRLLEKMVEGEEIQKIIQEAASRLEGEKARVAAEKADLEGARQRAVAEREKLEGRRRELDAALSSDVRGLYERVRKARDGRAVAPVVDGFCSACNVRLRPQAYNEVRTNQTVRCCDNCVRILYYVEPSIEPKNPDERARAEV